MAMKMLINAVHPEECRVAVVSDGLLDELDVQVKTYEATLANIYKGVITRVEPSLQAVFVDYGAEKNGFLPISDVHPSYLPESFTEGRKRPRIEDVFKKGDEVIVQVTKEARSTKGASLTTTVSLAGRYLVLMPGSDLQGISRKIEDEAEREKLRDIMKQLKMPENMGCIIRTAGLGRSKTELTRDLSYVLKLWKTIEEEVNQVTAPALLYREEDLVIRSIRDHFTPEITEILVDDKAVYNKAKEFFREVMPKYEGLVKLYQEKRPIFNKYQLEEQVEQIHQKRIDLKSGGYIVIEPTEAVVTIDVNSGSATREKGVAETAFRVNMEAAPEIARQLRLRDLGGIIIIDFIDMALKKHNLEVEKALKAELRKDRAKTKVLRISSLGVLELSRQRLKSSLGTGEYLECGYCQGSGKVRSPEMVALSVYRKIKSLVIKPDVSEVRAEVPPKVAEYLLNKMRALLVELEDTYGRVIVVTKEVTPTSEVAIDTIKRAPAPQPVLTEVPGEAASAEPVAGVETESSAQDVKKSKRAPRRRRRTKRKSGAATAEKKRAAEAPDLFGEQPEVAPEPAHAAEGSSPAKTPAQEEVIRPPANMEPSEAVEQEGKRKRGSLRRWLPFF
ncbi:MAG: Rne/Rng family ribonuclease [Deltaproteobacteria bacterium]|nr:Rne/Rng family ribonuclease [Deltaproteobacteria bacterium]